MKIGIRKPSIKKSIAARTTGKYKRKLKRMVNPLYGKKGMGFIKNPKKAIKAKIYRKTTISAKNVTKTASGCVVGCITGCFYLMWYCILLMWFLLKYMALGCAWLFVFLFNGCVALVEWCINIGKQNNPTPTEDPVSPGEEEAQDVSSDSLGVEE